MVKIAFKPYGPACAWEILPLLRPVFKNGTRGSAIRGHWFELNSGPVNGRETGSYSVPHKTVGNQEWVYLGIMTAIRMNKYRWREPCHRYTCERSNCCIISHHMECVTPCV